MRKRGSKKTHVSVHLCKRNRTDKTETKEADSYSVEKRWRRGNGVQAPGTGTGTDQQFLGNIFSYIFDSQNHCVTLYTFTDNGTSKTSQDVGEPILEWI